MSESEWFLRTFAPAPGYDVWIRVGLSPSTVSESKLFCEHLSLFVVSELEIFLEQLYIFILSDSEKFFRRHVLICCVWFRVVFQETCPYLLCLIQGCFSGDMSLLSLPNLTYCFCSVSYYFSLYSPFFLWHMNLSTADLRNYWTEFHETWWSYRYMFLVGPNVFSFVVKGAKVIFWGVQRRSGLL